MLDLSHIPSMYPNADVQVFIGDATALVGGWKVWTKPRGKTMCQLVLVGTGGDGGAGAVGAASTAAGGGGGASGAQTVLRFPLWAVPDCLYLSLLAGGTQQRSYVSIYPDSSLVAAHVLASASGGGTGGNASGATGGAAGAAAAVATAANMPTGWQWVVSALAGQAGVAGNVSDATNLTVPTTGLIVTGGTGGGGVPPSGTNSQTLGGTITNGGVFVVPNRPAASIVATDPTQNGEAGRQYLPDFLKFYGGRGGFGMNDAATGAGLVQASGGDGAPGCGGGGSGGALSGSTPGVPGKGGPAFAIFTCW